MVQALIVPIRCFQCGEPLTLFIAPNESGRLQDETWVCPTCKKGHAARIDGHVARALPGHPDYAMEQRVAS
jgi:hypothetical protein